MIQDIYDYLNTAISTVNTDLVYLDDPIGDDDYATTTELEKGYKIIWEPMTTIKEANYYTRLQNVQVEISKKAYNYVTDDFIQLFDEAINIESEIINFINVGNSIFTNIISVGITPSVFNTNDKAVKMNINIQFERNFDC